MMVLKEKLINLKLHKLIKSFNILTKKILAYITLFEVYNNDIKHYLKCRNNTDSKNPKIVRANNWRIMLLPKCEVCDSKKSTFIKGQEASGLLSSLGIKALLTSTVKSFFRSSFVLEVLTN